MNWGAMAEAAIIVAVFGLGVWWSSGNKEARNDEDWDFTWKVHSLERDRKAAALAQDQSERWAKAMERLEKVVKKVKEES